MAGSPNKQDEYYIFDNPYDREIVQLISFYLEEFQSYQNTETYQKLFINRLNLLWKFSSKQITFNSMDQYIEILGSINAFINFLNIYSQHLSESVSQNPPIKNFDELANTIFEELEPADFKELDNFHFQGLMNISIQNLADLEKFLKFLYDHLTTAPGMSNDAKEKFIAKVVKDNALDLIDVAKQFLENMTLESEDRRYYELALDALENPLQKSDGDDSSVTDTVDENYEIPLEKKSKLQRTTTYYVLDPEADPIFPLKNPISEDIEKDVPLGMSSSEKKRKEMPEQNNNGKKLKKTNSFCLFETKKLRARNTNENTSLISHSQKRTNTKPSAKKKLEFQSPTKRSKAKKVSTVELAMEAGLFNFSKEQKSAKVYISLRNIFSKQNPSPNQ